MSEKKILAVMRELVSLGISEDTNEGIFKLIVNLGIAPRGGEKRRGEEGGACESAGDII